MDNTVDSTVIVKTSINSLPLEIKTLIVKLADLQDEKYWARYNSVNQDINQLFSKVLAKNKWRGRSLNALFLLNKEWSDLAAVELFKNVSIKNMHSSVFKLIVLAKRVHLVKTIDFSTTANALDALAQLPYFPNLKMIQFNASVIQHLFLPSTHTSSDDNKFALIALSRRRVSSLSFDGCSADEIIIVLQACDRLVAVEIGGRVDGTVEDLNLLGEILSTCLLERFFLDIADSLPESWSKLTWNSSSSMRFFRFIPEVFDSSSLDFLSIFSNSLNHLHINFAESELSNAEELQNFNKLQHLELTLLLMDSLRILKLLKNSPLVSLQLEFSDILYNEEDDPDINNIIQLLEQIPTLREIVIINRFINPAPFLKLINHCNLQNINVNFTQSTTHQTLDSPDYPPSNDEKLNHFEPILETALADGQMKLKELRQGKDVEGMEEMYNNCKWLRANSGVMRD